MKEASAVHPGEILLSELMEPLGLSSYRLAKKTDVPLFRVNDIVRRKRWVSADSALRFEAFFGMPGEFWLNLENDYDSRRANKAFSTKIKPYQAL